MTEKKNRNKKQSKAKTSSRVSKGNFGYFRSEKRRRLIITAILFAVPLFIFFTSWFYFKTRMTVWTVVTVVGCLPESDHDSEMQTNGYRIISENP